MATTDQIMIEFLLDHREDEQDTILHLRSGHTLRGAVMERSECEDGTILWFAERTHAVDMHRRPGYHNDAPVLLSDVVHALHIHCNKRY